MIVVVLIGKENGLPLPHLPEAVQIAQREETKFILHLKPIIMKTPILKYTVLYIFLCCFFSQCTQQELILPQEPEMPEVPVIPPCTQEEYTGEYPRTLEIDRIHIGNDINEYSGITASYRVLTDLETWGTLVIQIGRPYQSELIEEATIDFYNEVVVAVFDEIRPSLGPWRIEIASIVEHEDHIVVKILKTHWADSPGWTVRGQPFDIVRIPMCYEDRKPIIFE